MPTEASPTTRFTDRVENYLKARPGYPAEVVTLLERRCALSPASTVVDVGCGTGLLAKLFCDLGCRVMGVEPNAAMRAAGEQYLAGYRNFQMLAGQAESISLPGTSVDFVVAGQAFHWFDLTRSRHEFMRILRPNGWAVLVWNDREFTGSRLAEDYERLLVRFGIDYADVHQRGKTTAQSFDRFFGNSAFVRASYPHAQQLDYQGFVARVLSASYMPGPGQANHEAMMQEVERIFGENETNGIVSMRYTTSVTYGQMT